MTTSARAARDITRLLEAWFSVALRDLPWRRDRSPYRVWLSEIMLQQTQVSVVVDYFERFVTRFPTVLDLARADADDVLSMWSGLGYYARGRNLHRASQVVAFERDGRFPTTVDDLMTLPGVGPYTAAAIAAFAFDGDSVLVDGNVARVVSRLFDVDTPVDTTGGKTAVRALASLLVDNAARPPIHNEAMMELGALVCTPKSPACTVCPLEKKCRARAQGTVDARPMKSPKRARTAIDLVTVVVTSDDAVLLERRPPTGLFGGTFATPFAERVAKTSEREQVRALVDELGLAPVLALPKGRLRTPAAVERTLTHREVRLSVHRLAHADFTARAPYVVVPFAKLSDVGMSTAARAVLHAVIPGVDRFFGATRRRG
jgi:A/G-specific adenine glycosylase